MPSRAQRVEAPECATAHFRAGETPALRSRSVSIPVHAYDLNATLASGQAFRWTRCDGAWEGVVHGRWVRLIPRPDEIAVETAADDSDWSQVKNFLQTNVDLAAILATFPDDAPMRAAVAACRGLRLLRQDPWECLASFICSSTKQIVQIQQIIRLLCECFGAPVPTPIGGAPAFAFPTIARIARCTEAELRACKMGFRAPYLLGTAQALMRGDVRLSALAAMPLEQARAELLKFPGVGRKIADCVLLFGCGFPQAFPVDVWVMRALGQLYFPRRRRVTLRRLHEFSASHFGPHAGYAQQYLFHYMRTQRPNPKGLD